MFAVVKIDEYEKGISGWLKRRFEKDKSAMSYCSVNGAAPFVIINVSETKKGIDWNEIRNCAGVCAPRLLLDERIDIPVGYGIGRFKPKLYPNVLMFNNMVDVIRRMKIQNNDISLTVLDKYASLNNCIDFVFEHVRYVTVLTDKSSDYYEASKRVMENYGAAMIINSYNTQIEKSDIIFADKYDYDRFKDYKIVFCHERVNSYTNLIYGFDMAIPGYIMKNKPSGISSFNFICALYELNNLQNVTDLSFSHLAFCSQEIDEDELAKALNKILRGENV